MVNNVMAGKFIVSNRKSCSYAHIVSQLKGVQNMLVNLAITKYARLDLDCSYTYMQCSRADRTSVLRTVANLPAQIKLH